MGRDAGGPPDPAAGRPDAGRAVGLRLWAARAWPARTCSRPHAFFPVAQPMAGNTKGHPNVRARILVTVRMHAEFPDLHGRRLLCLEPTSTQLGGYGSSRGGGGRHRA